MTQNKRVAENYKRESDMPRRQEKGFGAEYPPKIPSRSY